MTHHIFLTSQLVREQILPYADSLLRHPYMDTTCTILIWRPFLDETRSDSSVFYMKGWLVQNWHMPFLRLISDSFTQPQPFFIWQLTPKETYITSFTLSFQCSHHEANKLHCSSIMCFRPISWQCVIICYSFTSTAMKWLAWRITLIMTKPVLHQEEFQPNKTQVQTNNNNFILYIK